MVFTADHYRLDPGGVFARHGWALVDKVWVFVDKYKWTRSVYLPNLAFNGESKPHDANSTVPSIMWWVSTTKSVPVGEFHKN